jgi:hypothetical protein
MNRQKIGAGLMALALPVIALSMSVGSANAASVESTVTAMEECAWQVAGVPTTITLTTEEKYVGDELVVSSETPSTITVGLSGSVNPALATSGTSTECTFYNDEKYPVLNVAMSSTSVRATYPGVGGVATDDPDLTFNVGALNPFEVDTTEDITCPADFVTPVTVSDLIDNSLTSLLSMISESVVNEYGAGSGPRCPIDTTYSLTIPSITGTPAAPGAVYSFSGGSVSFVFAAN